MPSSRRLSRDVLALPVPGAVVDASRPTSPTPHQPSSQSPSAASSVGGEFAMPAAARALTRMRSVTPWVEAAAAAGADEHEYLHGEMTATALMFAFLYVAHIAPDRKLAERQRATAEHYHGHRVLRHSFSDLVEMFKIMLAPGNLFAQKKWLERARLWRLILLQNEDGSWDATDGVGLSLLAQRTRPVPAPRGAEGDNFGGLAGDITALVNFDEVGSDMADGEGGGDGAGAQGRTRADEEDEAAARQQDDEEGGDGDAPGVVVDAAGQKVHSVVVPGTGKRLTFSDWRDPEKVKMDCPLSGLDAAAIRWSVPTVLADLEASTGGALPAARVWTTLLALVVLRRMRECFLCEAPDPSGAGGDHRTVVDYGMGYLDDLAASYPELDSALSALYASAEEFVAVWRLRHEVLVRHAKAAWDENAQLRATTDAHRSWGFFFNTLRRSHETFAAFLAPPTGKLQRWQRLLLLVTAIVAMLTVEIWLQEQRGTNCCIDAMLLLGCEPVPGTPCRGFTGDCGDLPAQFEAIPGSPLQGWVCTEFPDPAVPLHKLLASLIMMAVGIPVKVILAKMFEDSNRPAGVRRAWLKSGSEETEWEWAESEDTAPFIMLAKYSEELHLLLIRRVSPGRSVDAGGGRSP